MSGVSKEQMQAVADKFRERIEAAYNDESTSKAAKLKKLRTIQTEILKKLKGRQLQYCKEYLKDFNAVQAAIRAGYPESSANSSIGPRATLFVKEFILVSSFITTTEVGVTGEFVVNEFNKIAKIQASDLYYKEGDKKGELIEPWNLPPDVAAAVSEVKQKTTVLLSGQKQIEFSYKLHSKVAALDALGKHAGIYLKDNNQKQPINEPTVVMYMPDNGREAVPTQNTAAK